MDEQRARGGQQPASGGSSDAAEGGQREEVRHNAEEKDASGMLPDGDMQGATRRTQPVKRSPLQPAISHARALLQMKLAERLCQVNKEAAKRIRDHARSATVEAAMKQALDVIAIHLSENVLESGLDDGFVDLDELLKHTPELDCRPELQAALSRSLRLTLKLKLHFSLTRSLVNAMGCLVSLLQVPLNTALKQFFERYWQEVETLVVEQEVHEIKSRQGKSFSSPCQAKPNEPSRARSMGKSKQHSKHECQRPSGIQERNSVSGEEAKGEAERETKRDPTKEDAGEGGERPTDVMTHEFSQGTKDAEGREGAHSSAQSSASEEESLEGMSGYQPDEDTGEGSGRYELGVSDFMALVDTTGSAEEEEDVGEGE